MCGIVGYIGKNQAKDLLLSCLEKLEYRGYDSAGIAILNGKSIKFSKTKGRIGDLQKISSHLNYEGFAGIGHTRWATHGKPDYTNSHPHFNPSKTIAVVHNGIIENYTDLKSELKEKGYKFISETDTEVIPHLIDYYYTGNLAEAVMKAASKLEGSYAVCVICKDEPNKIVALKKDSPLIIAPKHDGVFIASDTTAVLQHTNKVYYMEDDEVAVVTHKEITFYNTSGIKIQKSPQSLTQKSESTEKQQYSHFMLKEIFHQPTAVRNTLNGRITDNLTIDLGKIKSEDFRNIKKIYIVACGTAYHSAITGKYAIEKLSRIPTETEAASEFRYKNPIIDADTLVIAVTQSGETADTLAAMRLARERSAKVMAITNVEGSTASREADYVFYTRAGIEISVASTKAYTTQLTAMYILAIFFAEITKTTPQQTLDKLKCHLSDIPDKIEKTLTLQPQIQQTAKKLHKEKYIFYMGRGIDYGTALEGSLKLKETSYIHSEAYPGGELKHGPIALIEKGTAVVAINTDINLAKKTDNNIKEVITRGARVTGIVPKGFENFRDTYENLFFIPETDPLLYPLLSAIPLQLLAYHIAVYKNCDVDKPRNLAKSVTVE